MTILRSPEAIRAVYGDMTPKLELRSVRGDYTGAFDMVHWFIGGVDHGPISRPLTITDGMRGKVMKFRHIWPTDSRISI